MQTLSLSATCAAIKPSIARLATTLRVCGLQADLRAKSATLAAGFFKKNKKIP
jgi:hypothetical protein